ncbi:ATPase [Ramlibacter tataouinensis]|uniref:ATPase n=1 Tax=Ramlibacter tataouinensis TaxID=94132 RepID=A0A127JZH3_9BURK|nr:ATPase [Ramlibacter tataouinensis]
MLRRLEWTTIRRLDGLLQGDYRTLLRGAGLDLADLREYQHHDDVRHIDWNVTARMQVPHVRVFTEDREMAAWFLMDLSPSVDFGSGEQRKRNVSADFVAVLARLLTRHGNRVGSMLYGSGVDSVIPTRGGRRHVLHLLHAIRQRPAPVESGPTRLRELLDAAASLIKRRSTLFVVSDFISEPGWERSLAQLAQRHEVVAVRVLDPLELELPDLGLLTIRDAETGEQLLVDTHDAGFRKRFARIAAQREAELREGLTKAGVDALELSTDGDLVDAVVRFADMRKRRARLSAGGSLPAHLKHAA